MSGIRSRGEKIRRFILENVGEHSGDIGKLAASKFNISRQAVNKHLQKLTGEGALCEKGNTKSRTYVLAPLVEWRQAYVISPELAEDVVWSNDIATVLGAQAENVMDIWHFGLTEMLNNAIDHSGGTRILVQIKRNAITTEILLGDNGIGIFKKIQTALNLIDERHAVLELAKGKFTTDPKHHTGEGIFFTSRIFDSFNIASGGVYFSHFFEQQEDWILEKANNAGTTIWMRLSNHTARTCKKIFEQYTPEADDYGFTKTVVPVKLAQYGNDKLISRSQAKRLLMRVELFKTVLLDFKDVPTIGQAFADEIFRVFVREHPTVSIYPTHANSEVRRMIARVSSSEEMLKLDFVEKET